MQLLILYTLTVVSMHWAISAYATRKSGTLLPPASEPRALPPRPGPSRDAETRSGARPPAQFCVDRIAAYYAPRWTQPRQEDFAFLVHVSRTWKAAAQSSLLFVFADAHSHPQLEKTCRAYAKCRSLSAPPFPLNRTTAAYSQFVQVLRRSLRKELAQSCSEPAAGILIYAPAASERGASLDSRMLYSHTNTTTCLDANASPCMVFSW